jgi:cellulose synthase (UDP-forming)
VSAAIDDAAGPDGAQGAVGIDDARVGVPSGEDTPATGGRGAPASGTKRARKRRRQWGTERMRPPLPAVEPPASTAATWMGGLALVATVVSFVAYLAATIVSQVIDDGIRSSSFFWQSIAYVFVMGALIFSTFCFLLARQGALYRSRDHARSPRAELDAFMTAMQPSLTVLVPSYRESPEVVRATLLSAALQEYPGMSIVLLLDDPPTPADAADAASLAACRAVPGEIESLLAGPHKRFSASLAVHEKSAQLGGAGDPANTRALALDFRWAGEWLREQQQSYVRASNADDFLADEVLGGLAGDFEATARALFAALDEGAALPAERLRQLCRRLVWTFEAGVTSFERKAFANLPHDANKAMNLNAYIGLMGRRVKQVDTRAGVMLRESDAPDAVEIADTDYVLTLDADSVLLREYVLRLVHHMELPGKERVAVAQTPYSSFRGAPTRLERIAAATTDMQHVLHQGMTYWGATFWVGANAVIRKKALDELVEVSFVGGHEVRRYVQDHTVIEDTESSIDLIARGWTLYNYPERLSYSATPPDFGSLAVQRGRWANGGLLILPKFLKYVRRERKAGRRVPFPAVALRVNYMASIAWASVGLIVLLAVPFNSRLLSPIIVVAALPYFLAMSHDFHRMGYKRTDVFRVYAFNLILLAVNLGGTLKSLQQAAAKSKIAFARTPKVANRTSAPALPILAAYLIAIYSFATLAYGVRVGNWGAAAFAAFNGILTTYAIFAFIGVWNSLVDVVLGAFRWVMIPRKPKRSKQASEPAELDWDAVLYYGPDQAAMFDGARPRAAVRPAGQSRHGDTRSRQRD